MEKNKLVPDLLGEAKAGNYRPSLLTKIYGSFYPKTIPDFGEMTLAEILVLDISFYQVFANFEQMLDNGVSGTIIRAGQNLWEDSKAKTFMNAAKAANMPFGSYWFFDSRADPRKQAELWSKILEGYDTKLWIWADYEENYGGQWKGWDGFYQFLEACKEFMPNRKLGIYTGYYYWIDHSPNPITQAANLNYFKQYPLWLAWYVNDPSIVRIPKPWTMEDWIFWQRSASGDGTKYGVGSREVDMNKFMGTDFYHTFGLGDNGGTNPMPEVNWRGTVISGPAIVRSSAGGVDTNLRLPAGTAVEATGSLVPAGVYQWRNIVTPVQGWVADHLLDGDPVSPTPVPTNHVLEVILDGVVKYRLEF